MKYYKISILKHLDMWSIYKNKQKCLILDSMYFKNRTFILTN